MSLIKPSSWRCVPVSRQVRHHLYTEMRDDPAGARKRRGIERACRQIANKETLRLQELRQLQEWVPKAIEALAIGLSAARPGEPAVLPPVAMWKAEQGLVAGLAGLHAINEGLRLLGRARDLVS